MSEDHDDADHPGIRGHLDKLLIRIKHTSSVRFTSSKRLRTDYSISQLTVVILSLWAIVISYALATDLAVYYRMDVKLLTGIGVILPVFIVVFSLLENGETFLRSYQLEANARQLRELSDQLYTAAAVKGLRADELLKVYDDFSQRYSDCLERTQVNHDDVDHYQRVYHLDRKNGKLSGPAVAALWASTVINWCRMHSKRALYVAFWFAPVLLFLLRHPEEPTRAVREAPVEVKTTSPLPVP